MSVYYGATEKQALRRQIIRDLIQGDTTLPNFARHRFRAFLTGIPERERILDELAHLEPKKRERIRRKKLTPLDRALSDAQAAALDRAFCAWLALEGKSKSVNPMSVGGGGEPEKLPLSQAEFGEVRAYNEMRKSIGDEWRNRLGRLCYALSPWRDEHSRQLSELEIKLIVRLAERVRQGYQKMLTTSR